MASIIENLPNDSWKNEDVLSYYTLSAKNFYLGSDPQDKGNETETISELAEITIIGVKNREPILDLDFYHFLPEKITIELSNWIYFNLENEQLDIDEYNSGEISFFKDSIEYSLYIEEVDCEGLIEEAIDDVCDDAYIAMQIETLKDNCQREEDELDRMCEEDERDRLLAIEKENKASITAAHWLSELPLALDTETTGLDESAQIIEIAVYDVNNNEVFYSRLRPTVAIGEKAEEVHGISFDSLHDARTWPEISQLLKKCLVNRQVIIFNSDYDIRLLKQTAAAFDDPAPWITELETHCAMYLAADKYGATNKYGTISLVNATSVAGVKWRGDAHGAIADTLATLDLVKAIAYG